MRKAVEKCIGCGKPGFKWGKNYCMYCGELALTTKADPEKIKKNEELYKEAKKSYDNSAKKLKERQLEDRQNEADDY